MQTLGFQQIYRDDADFKLYIHQVRAIVFVPAAFFVRLAWIGLQENSPEFDNKKSFVQYMDRWQLSYSFVECLYIRGSDLTLITMLKDGILK